MNDAMELSPQTIKSFLSKGWMTHDAMWFFSCLQELGIEKTNELNLSAIRYMTGIEVKRLKKILGMKDERIDSADKLWRFFEGARQLVIPDWMDFSFHRADDDSFQWRWNTCFAHEGIKQIGAVDGYQCGIMFRITCWLDALGIRYSMNPEISGCLMNKRGECAGEIRFHLGS